MNLTPLPGCNDSSALTSVCATRMMSPSMAWVLELGGCCYRVGCAPPTVCPVLVVRHSALLFSRWPWCSSSHRVGVHSLSSPLLSSPLLSSLSFSLSLSFLVPLVLSQDGSRSRAPNQMVEATGNKVRLERGQEREWGTTGCSAKSPGGIASGGFGEVKDRAACFPMLFETSREKACGVVCCFC